MRLEPSRTAATASLTVALATRLFYGLALDAPEAANAAWLAAPAGLLMALPVVWVARHMDRGARRWLSLPLFLLIALDAAAAVEWTGYSESCLAFDHVSPIFMMLPLLLALLRCAWLGGDALGGAARFWVRLFALLILVVVIYQLPYYNPGWLRPWLGYGSGGVLRAGVRAAGWMCLVVLSAMTVCREELAPRDILPGMLLATAVAAALTALCQMMAPAVTAADMSRAMAVEALLTNGRAPLYLQLPMIVAWFAGMLHLMSFEGIAACGLLHRAAPRAGETACLAAGLGAVAALALIRAPRLTAIRSALPYMYHALAAATLALRLFYGRRSKCASSV